MAFCKTLQCKILLCLIAVLICLVFSVLIMGKFFNVRPCGTFRISRNNSIWGDRIPAFMGGEDLLLESDPEAAKHFHRFRDQCRLGYVWFTEKSTGIRRHIAVSSSVTDKQHELRITPDLRSASARSPEGMAAIESDLSSLRQRFIKGPVDYCFECTNYGPYPIT